MNKFTQIAFAIIVLAFTVSSCSNNDDDNYNYCQNVVKNKIDSVQIPQSTMTKYTVQTIKTYSTYAGNCEAFYAYDYNRSGFSRLVTAYKCAGTDCVSVVTDARASFINFRPEEAGTYLFRFYKGDDSSGNPTYIDRQVVVTDN